HKIMFDAMQVGECAQCHSNHGILAPTDEMIGVSQGSVCISCHGKGDVGYEAAEKMRSRVDELTGRVNHALEILNRAERAGMDVSRPKFELSGAKDSLTQARVLIHGISIEEVEKAIGPGLEIADKGYAAGEEALGEWRFRRKGLGVSLFFVLFLAAVIYLKIRRIEHG